MVGSVAYTMVGNGVVPIAMGWSASLYHGRWWEASGVVVHFESQSGEIINLLPLTSTILVPNYLSPPPPPGTCKLMCTFVM